MYKNFIKRIFDIVLSLIGLPFLLLIIIFVSPLIYLTDRGPVFYNAERIGRNGKLFKMYKFRSMYVNAPDIRMEDGSTYNSEFDPRVTKIGRIIRKFSIDETPQLLNVLKGEMSFIGPRPDPPDWLTHYTPDIEVFLSVRPGITGYNQAYFRNGADGFEKMKNDAFYAENCTFAMDFKILFKTIETVLMRENIYIENTGDIDIEEQVSINAENSPEYTIKR